MTIDKEVTNILISKHYFNFMISLFLFDIVTDPSQLNAMYPGRTIPKIEPPEGSRNPWMSQNPRMPIHPHCKIFILFLFCIF